MTPTRLLTVTLALCLIAPLAHAAGSPMIAPGTPRDAIPSMPQMPSAGAAVPDIEQERSKAGCEARGNAEKMIAEGRAPAGLQDVLNNMPSADECKQLAEKQPAEETNAGGSPGSVSPSRPVSPVSPAR